MEAVNVKSKPNETGITLKYTCFETVIGAPPNLNNLPSSGSHNKTSTNASLF
jgi:hypothetical protein